MSAIRSATAGVPADTIVPEKPAAPRVGMSDYRRGFALLRRFHGGRRPFVLGAVLLLVEALAAVVEPIPIAYLIDYLQGHANALSGFLGARPSAEPGGRPARDRRADEERWGAASTR